MALLLPTTYNGYTAEYWNIYKLSGDKSSGKSTVRLALYKDKATRQENIENFLKLEGVSIDGFGLTLDECYAKIKEPKMEMQGEVEVDTNRFSQAEDDL